MEVTKKMTIKENNICNLLDQAIDIVNDLLIKGEDKEKVKEFINKIEEPVLRRCVLVYTGLWN